MPLFEYACRACAHRFEAIVFGSRKPSCPKCESRNLEKLLSTFAVSSKGGARGPGSGAGPCGSCGDPRGPGSCSMN